MESEQLKQQLKQQLEKWEEAGMLEKPYSVEVSGNYILINQGIECISTTIELKS